MSRSPILSATLCLALASTAAFATDGVIEINQARANAGQVTPGDTPGFPVTISQSGSYRLTGNLSTTSTNTHVISVTASDVTIDLNGFSILGPNTCAGAPPVCTNVGTGDGINAGTSIDRVTVRNGNITGMSHTGVALDDFARVEDIRASHNGYSGIGAGGSSVIVGCVVAVNNQWGIRAVGSSNHIQNCISISNGNNGIETGSNGLISGCTTQFNGGSFGGFVTGSDSLVTSSVARSNASYGLFAGTATAYSNCLFNSNNASGPQVSSGGRQIGTNYCGNVACP